MKRILNIIVIILLLNTAKGISQIPNSSFELTNTFGNISNWGIFSAIPVWFDSLGVGHTDSIVIDNQYYFQTTDAHSGNYALEMRNGYDFTLGTGMTGGAFLSDSDYTSFTIPVAVQNQPTDLNFYYKYFPAGNDSAVAFLAIYDNSGNQIGEANIVIGGTMANYALATAPINYSIPGSAAYISMYFRTQLDYLQPTFGTRFLVDDVSLLFTSGISESIKTDLLNLYPNPSNGIFYIKHDINDANELVIITNTAGKTILETKVNNEQAKINLIGQPNGIYFVRLYSMNGLFTKRIIINN